MNVAEEFLYFLESRDNWEAMVADHPGILDVRQCQELVGHAQAHGVRSPMLGTVSPERLERRSENFREDFLAAGFNARQRAVMDRLLDFSIGHELFDARLHLHEALTPFALLFRGRYARALCSEYAGTRDGADWLFPIPNVDILASGLPDARFDAIITQEVLEHVPDIDAAFRDMARILAPGGIVLGTFPFDTARHELGIRAIMENGTVRHLLPPEYHGNPTDPEGGSLVFHDIGWDVLDRARAAGFSQARMVAVHSLQRGICGTEMLPILMFEAVR